jgi:hypothetical protein
MIPISTNSILDRYAFFQYNIFIKRNQSNNLFGDKMLTFSSFECEPGKLTLCLLVAPPAPPPSTECSD